MEDFIKMLTPEMVWCVLGVIMLLTEFAMPGFVIFFFGLGALFVAQLCFLINDLSLNTQLIIFIITSLVLLIGLRRWFKAIFKGFFTSKNDMPLNRDSYIGETAVVAEKITPSKTGKIEFHGTLWTAESDEEISKDTTVVIIKQNNLTFKVKGKEV